MSSKRRQIKNRSKKVNDYSIGSETIGEKLKEKTPWIFGKALRKPKIKFPKLKTRRISIPMPSKTLALIVIYTILFILQTGVVYLVYKDVPALGADRSGDAIFLYTSTSDAFIIESIVASILLFLNSTGFILLYQASKHLYDRKIALRILVIGFLFIIVTFVLLQYMIGVKTGNIDA
ncbi:MAG: hypothetical protein R6U96_16935 [Promethearchaeia archaeon]